MHIRQQKILNLRSGNSRLCGARVGRLRPALPHLLLGRAVGGPSHGEPLPGPRGAVSLPGPEWVGRGWQRGSEPVQEMGETSTTRRVALTHPLGPSP